MNTAALRRLVCGLIVACCCVISLPQVAHAQNETIDRPTAPAPSKSAKPPKVRLALLMAIIFAAGIGANTIPSKRGHQD